MPNVLYDSNLISEEELIPYRELISNIEAKKLRPPQIKMLSFSYQGNPVYRARIDGKGRLIYSYTNHEGKKTLCILLVNDDHNYDRLKRQLKSTNPIQPEILDLPEEELLDKNSNKTPEAIKFLPAVAHKETMLALDEDQQLCFLNKGAAIYSGPPGAGKTLVLYNKMLRSIYAQLDESHNTNEPLRPILFISQSRKMLKMLSEDYQKFGLKQPVKFVNWLDFISSYYPQKKVATEAYFKIWLTTMKCKGSARELHYEMSLIVALGEEKYRELGNRQCHFAEDKEKKEELITLLKNWCNYIEKHGLFDPVLSIEAKMQEIFAAIYCDETQNKPPAALAFLIRQAEYFIASLDTNQCLLSSPYIHNCLKELLYKRYTKYATFQLPRTRRCPPEIMDVANHAMNSLYSIAGGNYRREFPAVQSMLPNGSGLLSWVNEKNLSKLKELCGSDATVVIVKEITNELRETINRTLGTNNISTPEDAIGMEFDNVILWEPFSQFECFRELAQRPNLPNSGLSLEQWNAICSIYVSLTRAQKKAYLFDDQAKKRLKSLPEFILGEVSLNQFDNTESLKATETQWRTLADNYLEEGNIENAKGILRFHVGCSESEIDTIVKTFLAKENSLTNTNTKTNTNTNTANTNTDMDTNTTTASSTTASVSSIPNLTASNPSAKKTKQTQAPTVKKQIDAKQSNTKQVANSLSADQIRINKILAKFNQNELKELFKAKDGMKLLFEVPTEHYSSLFVQCLTDGTGKFATFRKFIKDNGKIAAEKLTPHRVIEAKYRCKYTNIDSTLISRLHEMNLMSILHILMEKYSPAQKIIFLYDAYLYSPAHKEIITKDEKIASLLNFNEKSIANQQGELAKLLCQPTHYRPNTSYVYHLADSSVQGTQLIDYLIIEQELMSYLSENLYTAPKGLKETIFLKLAVQENGAGIDILLDIYNLSPNPPKTISIDNLLARRKGFPTPFHNLCKLVLKGGHLVLKTLITPELAAKLPHDLPNIMTVFFLCCSQAGVEVLQLMMDNQTDLVAKMTGEVISTMPYQDKVSILSLLSQNEGGPAILNQLLDYHGEKLLEQFNEEALLTPATQEDLRGAYELLLETEEGKHFLNRLEGYGWSLPYNELGRGRLYLREISRVFSLSMQAAFFATSKKHYELSKPYHAKPIDMLLWYLYKHNKDEVIKMVNENPNLVFSVGNLVDDYGRRYEITPLEYCNLEESRGYLNELMMDCLNAHPEIENIVQWLSQLAQSKSANEMDESAVETGLNCC